ncbi:PAS domain-containing protein [Streptomyces sp. TR06-5]|uniref:PAS domain-containing protein n=1 Tax=unclassified Streptomyces TaxID=2593676 RepID=UPI0039A19AEC
MSAQSETHSDRAAPDGGGPAGDARADPRAAGESAAAPSGSPRGNTDDELLLAALLDGMDTALCAFDADGAVTHWNREAERILGWTREQAVGRRGLSGWAVRNADAPEVEARLLEAMKTPDRQVHDFPMVTSSGGRVLVRTQLSGVTGHDGAPAGVYCAFGEVHDRIDLERSIALGEALLTEAPWGVVVVDADLRPVVANAGAARALRAPSRGAVLGRPLGELLDHGAEELEHALQHVLAEGTTPGPAEIWLDLRRGAAGGVPGEAVVGARDGEDDQGTRRCWRSTFLRLTSPLAEQPVPLGVAWFFRDITDEKRSAQDLARLRFRDSQLHRAARAAAECADPMAAAAVHLDFALAGFADHALLDVVPAGTFPDAAPVRLLRAAAAPSGGDAPSDLPPVEPGLASGIPVGYDGTHPAVRAHERGGTVRTSVGGAAVQGWAEARKWPPGTVHGLCAVLTSRGRTLGVVTFLRGSGRPCFDRADASYAEDIAVRIAAAVDLALALAR